MIINISSKHKMTQVSNKQQSKLINGITVVPYPSNMNSNLRLIEDRIRDCEVPFYKINLGSVFQQFVRWRNLLPRIQPFFAIKCQPDPKVIELLGKLGAGFDCASKQEIKTVIETMSFNSNEAGKNIIFANPYKFKNDISYASEVGVTTVTFDTESELVKLSQQWPSVQLILRLSPQRVYDATCILGNKFGADSEDVEFLLQRAKELSMNVVGVSFHVGSGCKEMDAFPETVIYCSQVMKLARQMGFNPTIVDIGGGFPGLSSISGDDVNKQLEFEQMCSKLNHVIDTYFPEQDNYKIIAEPGRYFVYGAYTLVTQVIGIRSLDLKSPISNNTNIACHNTDHNDNVSDYNNNDLLMEKGFRYVINDGVYNSFNCIVFDHAKPVPLGIFDNEGYFREMSSENKLFVSTIYGPTCDGFDCIIQQEPLPKMDIGNWILWPNMGAYTIAASSCFNGIQMAETDYFMYEEDESCMAKYMLAGIC